MKSARIPCVVRNLFNRHLTWEVQTTQRALFLTFDDGPHPEITPQVLQVLAQHHAKATFFCVGENVKKYPETFQMILDQGHAIGNHTFNHLDGWKTKTKDYLKNVADCSKQFQSDLFRPPYGHLKLAQIAALKNFYAIVMWSVLSYDFDKNTSPEQCLGHVKKNVKAGSIIVFHDSEKASGNVLYALPKSLEFFSEKGFVFSALTKQLCIKN